MKTITEIVSTPTVVLLDGNSPIPFSGLHEYAFRSYHVLAKVKQMLEIGTPVEVVLELIEFFDKQPEVRKQL